MCVGIEKIWNSDPDVGDELDELAALVAARRPDLGDHAGAANRRHAVADSAARAVERRAEPVFYRLDFREILEAQPELLEVAAGDSRQRISGQRPDRLAGDPTHIAAMYTPAANATSRFTAALLVFDDDLATHEAVPRAAHLRAFEGVSAGRVGSEDQRGLTTAALRNDQVLVGSDDPEPVVRVVAPQAELDDGPAFDLDLRGAEREAFGRQPDHLAVLRGTGRRGEDHEEHGTRERAAADEPGAAPSEPPSEPDIQAVDAAEQRALVPGSPSSRS